MKREGVLWDKVVDFSALCLAAKRAAKRKRRCDEACGFIFNLESEVITLQQELINGTYQPAPYRTFHVTDPKERTISAAAFRDRVVHHAICAVLEPVLERYAIKDSYACRKGKGSHAALHQARKLMHSSAYYLKLDIRKYFETIDIPILKILLRRKLKDQRLLNLVDLFLDHGAPGSIQGKGLPIGNLTSQHFANFYLGYLDHFIKQELCVEGYVRYMDDMILFGLDKSVLHQWHEQVRVFLAERLHLLLKDECTLVAPVHEGLPFLGFRVYSGVIRLDRGSCRRFQRKLKERIAELNSGAMDEQTFVLQVYLDIHFMLPPYPSGGVF